jgi:uncharacterized protein YrrD
MLKLADTLTNLPIFSLRTGHEVGIALRPLLNPKNLKVEAWFASSRFEGGLTLLPVSEVREFGTQGIAVNDREAITPAEDLVRLTPLIKLDFQLIGKKVFTENRELLGKVNDYATDVGSFFVQRLYVTPTLLKKLTGSQKTISRLQIVEITDKKIIVKDATVPSAGLFKPPRPAPAPEG